MGAVELAVRFTPQNSLFDAERLPSYFWGGFRSAAGSADENEKVRTNIKQLLLVLSSNANSLVRVEERSCTPHHVVLLDFSTDQVLACCSTILQ